MRGRMAGKLVPCEREWGGGWGRDGTTSCEMVRRRAPAGNLGNGSWHTDCVRRLLDFSPLIL